LRLNWLESRERRLAEKEAVSRDLYQSALSQRGRGVALNSVWTVETDRAEVQVKIRKLKQRLSAD